MELICQSFELSNGVYRYKDAICLTQEQWDTITAGELTAMKNTRFNNWLALVNPPEVIEPEITE